MNFIPEKEAVFVEWSGNLINVSKVRATEWGLSEEKVAELEPLHIEVKDLHEKCKTSAHTQLDMQAKNEKKKLIGGKKSEFARFHLQNNEKVSDNGCKELGIPIHM